MIASRTHDGDHVTRRSSHTIPHHKVVVPTAVAPMQALSIGDIATDRQQQQLVLLSHAGQDLCRVRIHTHITTDAEHVWLLQREGAEAALRSVEGRVVSSAGHKVVDGVGRKIQQIHPVEPASTFRERLETIGGARGTKAVLLQLSARLGVEEHRGRTEIVQGVACVKVDDHLVTGITRHRQVDVARCRCLLCAVVRLVAACELGCHSPRIESVARILQKETHAKGHKEE
mmetsp:Transcript_45829/g.115416  ORF Transcript_45829/g.115416 Transcript_45829/m.115416 type:complete len:230 (+) Transcript_45829:740-1429(+)